MPAATETFLVRRETRAEEAFLSVLAATPIRPKSPAARAGSLYDARFDRWLAEALPALHRAVHEADDVLARAMGELPEGVWISLPARSQENLQGFGRAGPHPEAGLTALALFASTVELAVVEFEAASDRPFPHEAALTNAVSELALEVPVPPVVFCHSLGARGRLFGTRTTQSVLATATGNALYVGRPAVWHSEPIETTIAYILHETAVAVASSFGGGWAVVERNAIDGLRVYLARTSSRHLRTYEALVARWSLEGLASPDAIAAARVASGLGLQHGE
jgi:hypothetical protein